MAGSQLPQVTSCMSRRSGVNVTWRGFLAGGALVVAVYLAVPGEIARDLVYAAVGLSSVMAIIVGVRRNGPRRASRSNFAAAEPSD